MNGGRIRKPCPCCAGQTTIDTKNSRLGVVLEEACNSCGYALYVPMGKASYEERRRSYEAAAAVWKVMGEIFGGKHGDSTIGTSVDIA